MDIQGHRGCRGLYPENTIPGFLHAVRIGVETLEMDAVVSKDGKTIISHEPFMSHEICTTPSGQHVTKDDEMHHNIYKLSYEEIKEYDCGIRPHPRFPFQKKLATHKPSLIDMATAIQQELDQSEIPPVHFNIEIKRRPEWDFTYHPPYQEFADIVIRDILAAGIMDRTTVQCFDIPTLQYLHKKYPDVQLVYLIENKNSPELNLDILGFLPTVYSPDHPLVDAGLVELCKQKGMKIIPWTVNKESDIQRMLGLKVSGIISDYPETVINLEAATD